MGTVYNVSWVHVPTVEITRLQAKIDHALLIVNQQMSTYRADSELSQFNSAQPPVTQSVSPALAEIIRQSLSLNQLTQGYFDISVGPLVNLWGFGPEEIESRTPSDKVIQQTQSKVGLAAIRVEGNDISKTADRYLDLSAIAKGYGVDVVAELLESEGIVNYLVEIGGEIRVLGEKAESQPWRIAVEMPDSATRTGLKVLPMTSGGLATSGDYRNYFEVNGERFSHTIDPFTARPVTHRLASVTVVDETSARADALATAMLVMGEDKAVKFAESQGIAAFFIVREGEGFREIETKAFKRWNNH